MLVIRDEQIEEMEKRKREPFVERLIQKFIKLNPEFLPKSEKETRALINKKVIESKEWGLENDQEVEKYLYLCFSYKVMLEDKLSKDITDILTWPSRSGKDKLEYLHFELIKDIHVTKP